MPQVPIIMPQLGESIAEATIVDIKVKPGDEVVDDQEIIDVETNKAVMGVTTPCKGKIDKITAELKETYPVGTVLGYVEASEQDAARFAKHAPPPPQQQEVAEEIPARSDQEVAGARKKDRCTRCRRRTGRRSARSSNYEGSNFPVAAGPRAHG
jgi:pyruvate/2-oxoglutarate dehydrogenase complex dihydrolipoamide acyltransferase (E2) component